MNQSSPTPPVHGPSSPGEPDSSPGAPAPGTPRKRSAARRLLFALAPLLLMFGGCRLITTQLVKREEAKTPRDPATGIAIGAEERDLGPEDAKGAVLFVHGFIGGSSNFADLPDRAAAAGWRVRCLRLPGHGTSPFDFEKTKPEELIEAVREETRALKAKHGKVVLAGHSMGGALSSIVAAEEGVHKLILGAPYFGVTHRWFYILPVERWTRLANPFLRWTYKGQVFLCVNKTENKPNIYSYAWIPGKGALTLVEIGEKAKEPGLPERIECPVLLLHAEGDQAASVSEARAVFDRLNSGDKRWVDLPKSNHHIFWDYDADLVMEEALAFLGPPPA